MKVPFFDSNPGIANELRAMDHNSREYKKYLRKVLMEMGGMIVLFNYLKTTAEGNRIRRKYITNLITMGALSVSLFVWIFIVSSLTGGRELAQYSGADTAWFIGFIILEVASIALIIFQAFRCQRILLQGVSYSIDHYGHESGSNGTTLGNYQFLKAKTDKIVIIAAVVGVLAYFGFKAAGGALDTLFTTGAKEFSKAGLTITLTNDFHEQDIVSQTAAYASSKYFVVSLKEEYTFLEECGISSDMSQEEYLEAVIEANSLDSTVERYEGRPYFTYNRHVNGKDFAYLAVAYKGSDAFWTVTFSCESANFESSKEQFMNWADTVTVS